LTEDKLRCTVRDVTPTTDDLYDLEERVWAAEDRLHALPGNASPRVRDALQAELDQLTAEWAEEHRHQRQILAAIDTAADRYLTPAA
jgi:hypothetical protein